MPNISSGLPDNSLTDNTCNHMCSKCGECCSDAITMTDTEIARIKRYIKRHGIVEEDHAKAYNLLALNQTQIVDMTCPFLKINKTGERQETSCNIYPVRPAICKAFTCEIASDPENMEKVYTELVKILTPSEVMKLTSNPPKSMRTTFFPK